MNSRKRPSVFVICEWLYLPGCLLYISLIHHLIQFSFKLIMLETFNPVMWELEGMFAINLSYLLILYSKDNCIAICHQCCFWHGYCNYHWESGNRKIKVSQSPQACFIHSFHCFLSAALWGSLQSNGSLLLREEQNPGLPAVERFIRAQGRSKG